MRKNVPAIARPTSVGWDDFNFCLHEKIGPGLLG